MSDATLRKPTERTCEDCGREEYWDDERDTWRVVREDGDARVGNVYCIHEWDINGSFIPIEEEVDSTSASA